MNLNAVKEVPRVFDEAYHTIGDMFVDKLLHN